MIDAITGLFRYCALARRKARGQNLELRMIHFVLHDANDGVAVVVVEGVKAGMDLNGWIMDEDRMTGVKAQQGGAEEPGRG